MSLRQWNSVAERARLQRYVLLAEMMLEEEEDDDSSDDDDSSEEASGGELMDMEMDFIDQELSFITDVDDDHEDEEEGDEEHHTADHVIRSTMDYFNFIYRPILDETIDFDKPPLKISDLDDSKALLDFRFRKDDLQEIADSLWPKLEPFLEGTRDKIMCENQYQCPYETGLLLVLYRLARPRRIRPELETYFSMRKSRISAIISTFIDAFYEVALQFLSDPSIFKDRFELYAGLIHEKSGVHGIDVWGFIDGTLRKTCRPSHFQKLLYSGHKRCHGIKFQSVTTPDGLIALLFGPVNGNRHDSFMLRDSRLLQMLRDLFPEGEKRYSLYGDPAYPQSELLFGGFRRPAAGSEEAIWNTQMSKVRETVEWLFKEIITKWSFLDFRASMKVFQFPVAKYFAVGAFLTNLHCCIYGSETAAYFNCVTPEDGRLTLQQYLSLVDDE